METEIANLEIQKGPHPHPLPEYRETAAAQEAPDLFCPQCGYSLRGIGDALRCPECGLEIDREAYSRSQIPWVYRREIGRWRSFWRTVWLATWRPQNLAAEAVKDVHYGDAQRFRVVTVVFTSALLGGFLVAAMASWGSSGFLAVMGPPTAQAAMFAGGTSAPPAIVLEMLIPWEAGATLPPVMPLATFVAVLLVSGVASYWFHPRDLTVARQNAAVALSYYACAPLAFLPVPIGALIAAALMRGAGLAQPEKGFGTLINVLGFLGAVAAFAWSVVAFRAWTVLLARATHPTGARLATAALLVPLSWVACAAVALLGLPWVVGFVRLFAGSLRG